MRRSNWVLALYMALVFLSGLVVGAIGDRLFTTETADASTTHQRLSPEEYRKHYIETMTTRLKLTPSQLELLNGVLDRTRGRFHEMDGKNKAERQTIWQRHTAEVNSFLSEEQQAEYANIRKEREERRKKLDQKDGRHRPDC
jgi:hypothetical protein